MPNQCGSVRGEYAVSVVLRVVSSRLFFWFFVFIYVLLPFAGVVKNYSAVPFWDLMDYGGYWIQDRSNWFGFLWSQHNEHRILWTRLVILVDVWLFDGSLLFAFFFNLLCFAFQGACVYSLAQSCAREMKGWAYLACLGVPCLFAWSWLQRENLDWAFQGQFLLAYSLPLASFLFWAKSCCEEDSRKSKCELISVGFACASVGSMANGILCLPVLLVLFFIYRPVRLGKVAGVCAVWIFLCFMYFYDYRAVPGHGGLLSATRDSPLEVVGYFFAYLGGVGRIFGAGVLKAQLLGVVGFSLYVFVLFLAIRGRERNPGRDAALAFCAYVLLSGVLTAGGRAIFGVEQAFASRYATPVLLFWATLFLGAISSEEVRALKRRASARMVFFVLTCLLLLVFFSYQMRALDGNRTELTERKAAALAVALGVYDEPQLLHAFYDGEAAMSHLAEPKRLRIGPFRLPEIGGGGVERSIRGGGACIGYVDDVRVVATDPRFLKIEGWLVNGATKRSPAGFEIFDGSQSVGRGVIGLSRADVSDAFEDFNSWAGFYAYLDVRHAGRRLSFVASDSSCSTELFVPPLSPVGFKRVGEKNRMVSVSAVRANDMTGSDFYHSEIEGYEVIGSYGPNGDRDQAALSLFLENGDRFLLRTGPDVKKMRVEFDGEGRIPLSREWAVYEVYGLPRREGAVVRFVDEGRGWGQWFAIAVKK